jgi:hypothetical protein
MLKSLEMKKKKKNKLKICNFDTILIGKRVGFRFEL